jgi:hypothetical protein
LIERAQVRVGHARASFAHALVGDPAFLNEVGVALED